MTPVSTPSSNDHPPAKKTEPTTSTPGNRTRKDSLLGVPLKKISNNIEVPSRLRHVSSPSSKYSSSSSQGTKRSRKSVTKDMGPMRGNRATVIPKPPSAPDVNAFLKHIAMHDQHSANTPNSSSSGSTTSSELFQRRPFAPQYAARGHGDMIPRVFPHSRPAEGSQKGKITQAVWQELEKQHKLNQAKSFFGIEHEDARNGQVGSQALLQRAVKDREGGYRHGVGS